MQMPLLTRWLARCFGAALLVGAPACVVHDTPPVNPGYGYGYGGQGFGPGSYGPPGYGPQADGQGGAMGESPANVSVGEPSPYQVGSLPPEPLYEQMTTSPGDGSVWIDGYWHWNGDEWVWVNGRWEHEQPGYVYVEPNYDYVADQFVYTPGYWSQPARVPRGWIVRDHRDGRPTMVAPPASTGGYRPPANAGHPTRPPVSNPGGGATVSNPPTGPRPTRFPGRDPNPGNLNYRPLPPPNDGPVIGTRPPGTSAPQNPGTGAVNAGAGGSFRPPVAPARPIPGGVWRPIAPTQPASGGYRPPPTSAQPAPGGYYRPPPASTRPIWVNPSAPSTGGYRPPSATPSPVGGPIYVRPAPGIPPGGGYRPAPISAPTVVHPAPIQPPAVAPVIVRPPPVPAPTAVAPPARVGPRR